MCACGGSGIDPSGSQLAFARARQAARVAQFDHGDAMALPFSNDWFDAAVRALVIFRRRVARKWRGSFALAELSLPIRGSSSVAGVQMRRSWRECRRRDLHPAATERVGVWDESADAA